MGSQECGNSYIACICGLVVGAICTHHLLGKLNHFWIQTSATASKTPLTLKLWSCILHNLFLKYFLPAQSKHHFLKQRFFLFCSAGCKVMLSTCIYRLASPDWTDCLLSVENTAALVYWGVLLVCFLVSFFLLFRLPPLMMMKMNAVLFHVQTGLHSFMQLFRKPHSCGHVHKALVVSVNYCSFVVGA